IPMTAGSQPPASATRGAEPRLAPARQQHTAGSAAALLMGSALLSGLLGLVRIKYIAFLFGAGVEQDAYRAAFKLPDLLAYFLVGSAASVSMITMLNRFLETGDEEGADRALSVVLTTMFASLAGVMVLAAIAAPLFVRVAYGEMFLHDARGPLCISLTRWLLPAQLFFFIGSMMSARLQVRKIFLYQALTPVIYNGGIVLGAVMFHRRFGVYSLVIGVLAGVVLGSALLNTLGALRTGLHLRPRIGFRDPAFVAWLRAAAPLMLGVSLVMFDGIFFNRFASGQVGQLTLINTAKDLFNAPFNIIGPAAGTASLPFFASLFQRRLMVEFSSSVGRSVSRLFAVGLLVSAWMLAVAPWLMDLLRGGLFNHADAAETTHLFRIFAVSLALWAVQGIYARAFYAASDTVTPAIAGTTVVLLSLPIYWALFRAFGMPGLAFASDIGILIQTAALALLLHRRRLVSLADLDGQEVLRALVAAVLAFAAAAAVVRTLPPLAGHRGDLITITLATAVWGAAAAAMLLATGSALPRQILHRR
ncbi:MAG: virulence factor MviN, partial [Acidobacteriota bacterium]|nr:virulence factor MviN [Acidobacteriota bacterium]